MNSMTLLQSVVLGVVQGITEFLPVSSSGHLILVPVLLGWEPGGIAFDTMVHLATFFAVLLVFWRDLFGMLRGVLGSPAYVREGKLGWIVLLATIPVVGMGLLFGDQIETSLRAPWIVAVGSIVWGIVLVVVDRLAQNRPHRITKPVQVGWGRALAVGCAQVLALIPGTSRSGITMTAGLALGFDRKSAARFSFLLSVPAVGGAAVYVFGQALQSGESLVSPVLIAGFIAAFCSGMLAIRGLLAVIERWSFVPFGVYRVLLGVFLLLLL